jgi:hypothetical protein
MVIDPEYLNLVCPALSADTTDSVIARFRTQDAKFLAMKTNRLDARRADRIRGLGVACDERIESSIRTMLAECPPRPNFGAKHAPDALPTT